MRTVVAGKCGPAIRRCDDFLIVMCRAEWEGLGLRTKQPFVFVLPNFSLVSARLSPEQRQIEQPKGGAFIEALQVGEIVLATPL